MPTNKFYGPILSVLLVALSSGIKAETITFEGESGSIFENGEFIDIGNFRFTLTDILNSGGIVLSQDNLIESDETKLFMINHSIITMSRVDGGLFTLNSLDIGGSWIDPILWNRWASQVDINGGANVITADLASHASPTYLNIETNFEDIGDVIFTPFVNFDGGSNNYEFILDNIVVDEPVTPEPPEVTLFSIAVLPDIQTYTAKRPQILEATIKWITDNQADENIIYVSQLGDLKDVGACINGTIAWPGPISATSTEWQIVRRYFDQLDTAGIPYGVSPGNHDFDQRNGTFPLDSGGCPNFDTQRPLLGYNDQIDGFPPSSFPVTNYGSRMPGSNEDNYVTVSSSGLDFLFINIGYQQEAPAAGSNAVIDWAEILVRDVFPNHITIITSHYMVDCNKTPSGGDISTRSPCAGTAATYNQLSTYGANIATRLRGYQNLFMFIGGHRFGEAYNQVDRSAEGFPPVHMVLANYQHLQYSATNFDTVPAPGPASGSSGYFKLMEFDMGDMTVDMVSMSPALAASSGITGGSGVFPVLSNGDRPAPVRSTRNIDVNILADRFNVDGTSTLHNRSVSNLNNISFTGYVTAAP